MLDSISLHGTLIGLRLACRSSSVSAIWKFRMLAEDLKCIGEEQQ